MQTTEELLAERGKTHGDFRGNAIISQGIKRVMRSEGRWGNLSDDQRESLDLIATKISRILTGNSNEPDHWDDIGGYAKLGKPQQIHSQPQHEMPPYGSSLIHSEEGYLGRRIDSPSAGMTPPSPPVMREVDETEPL